MNPDRVIAVRTQKTVYKDGDSCVKVFGKKERDRNGIYRGAIAFGRNEK